MAKPAQTPKRQSRLPAEERKQTILKAAREQFSKSGDISATTTKMIADKVGVSEAIVYRHFDTKEDLYIEAVVQPLQKIVERVVGTVEEYPQSPDSISDTDQLSIGTAFIGDTLEAMDELLPLLGLVLFGEQAMAKKFYQRVWRPSLNRISTAWRGWYEEADVTDFPDPDVAARILLGACMLCALDARYGGPTDREALTASITRAGLEGAWLTATQMHEASHRGRRAAAAKAARAKRSR